VRTLLATMARKTWPRVSENDCMEYRRLELRSGSFKDTQKVRRRFRALRDWGFGVGD
jgi:hypothetical protein